MGNAAYVKDIIFTHDALPYHEADYFPADSVYNGGIFHELDCGLLVAAFPGIEFLRYCYVQVLLFESLAQNVLVAYSQQLLLTGNMHLVKKLHPYQLTAASAVFV